MTKAGFSVEMGNNTAQEVVDKVLGTSTFAFSQVPEWNEAIIAGCLQQFQSAYSSYKFIVQSVIVQKTGAADVAHGCHWDSKDDVSVTFRWENKSMACIVTIFAVAI